MCIVFACSIPALFAATIPNTLDIADYRQNISYANPGGPSGTKASSMSSGSITWDVPADDPVASGNGTITGHAEAGSFGKADPTVTVTATLSSVRDSNEVLGGIAHMVYGFKVASIFGVKDIFQIGALRATAHESISLSGNAGAGTTFTIGSLTLPGFNVRIFDGSANPQPLNVNQFLGFTFNTNSVYTVTIDAHAETMGYADGQGHASSASAMIDPVIILDDPDLISQGWFVQQSPDLVDPAPEPYTFLLAGLGLGSLFACRKWCCGVARKRGS